MNKLRIIFITLFSFFYMGATYATDLVDSSWLKVQLKNGTDKPFKIIDLRSSVSFELGHIPNSINIPYSGFTRIKEGVNGFVETPKVFKELMDKHGINNDDLIVLYSDWSFLDSMRVYWVFDFYGHKNIKVLDGGIQSWISEDFPLTEEIISFQPSQYVIEINSEIMTTKFRTLMASKSDDFVIIDGRDNLQYIGLESLTDRKGHIPSAINLPWFELVQDRTEANRYKHISTPSIMENLDTLKDKLSIIPKDKKILLYCNGGQESSVIYFALKELGIKASVYDGSWYEWSKDKALPIVKEHN